MLAKLQKAKRKFKEELTMNIASKLYFEFKKEYADLLASDVAEFVATKDYETDIDNYKNLITTEEVKNEDGTHNYIKYLKEGVPISNIRGINKIEENKTDIANTQIQEQYKIELKEYVFNKLLQL